MLKGIEFSLRFLYSTTEPARMIKLGDYTITIPQEGKLAMQVNLPDDKELPFVAPTGGVDKKGNAVPIKGTVSVKVSDTTVLTLVQPDPSTPTVAGSGVLRAAGPLGNAQVIFEDDGDGSQPFTVTVDVTVTAGDLAGLAQPTFGPLRDITEIPTT